MNEISLGFSGAGFLFIYHLGAICAFNRNEAFNKIKSKRFIGSSSGAAAATIMAHEIDEIEALRKFIQVYREYTKEISKSPSTLFNLEKYIKFVLWKHKQQIWKFATLRKEELRKKKKGRGRS